MSDRPAVYIQNLGNPQPRSNGVGVAGFVLSLVGFVTCGLLCPIGLIFSAIGLRKEPRGLAVAGLVLGLLGSILPIIIFLIWGISVFSCLTIGGAGAAAASEEVQTSAALTVAREKIEQFRTAHGGMLPDDADGNALIASDSDGWGKSVRFSKIGADQFEIRSAGRDGVFATQDDRFQTFREIEPPQTEKIE